MRMERNVLFFADQLALSLFYVSDILGGANSTVIGSVIRNKVIDGYADVYESEFQRQGCLYLTGKSNFFRTVFSVAVFTVTLGAFKHLLFACLMAVAAQAMAYLLDHMIDRYPNVEIYFLLNSGLKEEFNESVRAICNHYNIDCIELHDIDKKSGHPSIKGMEQISEQIKMFMRKTK